MSILNSLVAYAVRSVVPEASAGVAWLTQHWTDHSQTLPLALQRASERAWHTLALALGGADWLTTATDWFRSADVVQLRTQLRQFWAQPAAEYAGMPRQVRQRAASELNALRSAGALAGLDRAAVLTDVRRYHAPGQLAAAAPRVLATVADTLAERAPNLAQVLRHTPADAPPLLLTAFLFFFRRELETQPALAQTLTFDQLQHLTAAHAAGLTALGEQLDTVLAAQGAWFAAADTQLHAIRQQLDQLLQTRIGAEPTTEPLRVSVTNETELAHLRRLRDELRRLPPEVSAATDWSRLGDGLAAGGLFREASEAQQWAAGQARAADDRTTEAGAAFKHYRAACESDDWPAALSALLRAAHLDPGRYAPFPLHRYTPQAILGAGGFGTVFHCLDRYAHDRPVAIKALMVADLHRDLTTVFAEAYTLGKLDHPGIVRVIDQAFADAEQTRPYIVMTYFPGVSLAQVLKQQGRLEPAAVVRIARAAADALHAAHSCGILRRDLKPGNLLVTPDTTAVQLIDFGLAVRLPAVVASLSTSVSQRTRREQSFAGTLEYAAPEQKGLLAGANLGPPADVYSLGKTCLEALLGTPEPLSSDWDTLPTDWRHPLRTVFERCIARQPERRFATGAALERALAEVDPAEQLRRAERVAAAEHHAKTQALLADQCRSNLGRWLSTTAPERWVRARLNGLPPEEWQARLLHELETGPYWPLDLASVSQALVPIRDRLRQQTTPIGERRPGALHRRVLRQQPRIEVEFAWIAPGRFQMGDTEFRDEQPVHTVIFERGFWLSCTTVTQAQWQAVMTTNPSHFRAPELPVERVSWTSAQTFCAELTRTWDQRVGLPSEAQWEYACRAGTTTPFHFGSIIETGLVNCDARETLWGSRLGGRRNRTLPVRSFPPNRWHLYEMHGNVWEWCRDGYGPHLADDQFEPQDWPRHNHNSDRVLRGGSYQSGPLRCRSAFRHFAASHTASREVGLRVVLEE
jgi:formylglycine-generating enzyme required for sulfatase activity